MDVVEVSQVEWRWAGMLVFESKNHVVVFLHRAKQCRHLLKSAIGMEGKKKKEAVNSCQLVLCRAASPAHC